MSVNKVNRLKNIANNVFGVNVDNKNRETETIEARATCYSIMRKEFHMGYTEIGKHFLKKHATIMHGIKEYPYMIKFKPAIGLKYDTCLNLFKKNEIMFDDSLEVVDLMLIKKTIMDLEKSNSLLSLTVTQLKQEMKELKNLK